MDTILVSIIVYFCFASVCLNVATVLATQPREKGHSDHANSVTASDWVYTVLCQPASTLLSSTIANSTYRPWSDITISEFPFSRNAASDQGLHCFQRRSWTGLRFMQCRSVPFRKTLAIQPTSYENGYSDNAISVDPDYPPCWEHGVWSGPIAFCLHQNQHFAVLYRYK